MTPFDNHKLRIQAAAASLNTAAGANGCKGEGSSDSKGEGASGCKGEGELSAGMSEGKSSVGIGVLEKSATSRRRRGGATEEGCGGGHEEHRERLCVTEMGGLAASLEEGLTRSLGLGRG